MAVVDIIAQRQRTAVRQEPIVRLVDVVKEYSTPTGPHPALCGISLEVAAGGLLVIYGRSGAGKTTLLNMITGVDGLTSGEVWVNGTAVHTLSEDDLALWRGTNVGVIYQSFELLPQLSLIDNVMLPMDLCGLYSPRGSRDHAIDLLSKVGLADHVVKRPSEISGGQQQRVAIARALANDPAILVADEPTGNLDSGTANEILALFEHLVDEGMTIIMVTHDKTLRSRASRVIDLVDGQIAGDTAPDGGQSAICREVRDAW